MSADAKIWQDEATDDWCGIHDGDCKLTEPHRVLSYDIVELIGEIEKCMGMQSPRHIRWLLHVYPNGQAGLRGFTY